MNDQRDSALMLRPVTLLLAALGAWVGMATLTVAGPPSSAATQKKSEGVAAQLVKLLTPADSGSEGLRSESEHLGTFNGKVVPYHALVDTYELKGGAGEKIGTIVSTTYRRSDIPKNQPQAVLFTFNGGPGSASLWLQLGLVGPKRIDFSDDLHPRTVPPFKITENAESPIDIATVVLIDPPGTGYSTFVPGKDKEVFGVEQDATAIVKFIRDWSVKNGQQNAPKFLLGESYGTIRAARVAKLLAGGPSEAESLTGISLNGIILLGQALEFLNRDPRADLTYVNVLPTMAAVAWYHGRVDRKKATLEVQIDKATGFAAGEYLRVLFKGSGATPDEKSHVAQKLAALTGLPETFVLRKNLRVSAREFSNELLASQGQQVGMYDGRYTLPLVPSGGDSFSDDPAMAQYVPGFVAGYQLHLRNDLNIATDLPYKAIDYKNANARWDYGHGPGNPPSGGFSENLAIAMRRNPALKLLVGSGTYDLVTTMGDAEYMINHAGIDRGRVIHKRYPSGHMPYLGAENRKLLGTDLRAFIKAASADPAKP